MIRWLNSPYCVYSVTRKQNAIRAWFTCRAFRERRPWNRKRCRPFCHRSRSSATGRRGTCRRGCRAPASLPPSSRHCRPESDRRRRLHNKPVTFPLRHRYVRHVFPARFAAFTASRHDVMSLRYIKLLCCRPDVEQLQNRSNVYSATSYRFCIWNGESADVRFSPSDRVTLA